MQLDPVGIGSPVFDRLLDRIFGQILLDGSLGHINKLLVGSETQAIGPALMEKGILDSRELQELCEELRRVEEEDDVLCVWSPTFSVWVNRT